MPGDGSSPLNEMVIVERCNYKPSAEKPATFRSHSNRDLSATRFELGKKLAHLPKKSRCIRTMALLELRHAMFEVLKELCERLVEFSSDSNWLAFEPAKELQAIAGLLDEHPTIADLVWQDLAPKGLLNDTSAQGLSAEQVLRASIIKQLNKFSYRELAFHLADSVTYRRFCQLGWNQVPSKSVLASCIKAIQMETLEKINRLLVGIAQKMKIEDGKKIRVDTTVVQRPLELCANDN